MLLAPCGGKEAAAAVAAVADMDRSLPGTCRSMAPSCTWPCTRWVGRRRRLIEYWVLNKASSAERRGSIEQYDASCHLASSVGTISYI